MSELETRRAAASAGEPDPDMVRTAELIQYDDAELAEPDPDDDFEDFDAQGSGLPGAELDSADADLLAIPPRADDLGTALAARPQRAKLPKVTLALAGAVLICAGFIGGVLTQKHLGGGSSSSGGRGNFAAFSGGRTGTGTAGGFFGRGGTGAAGGTGGGAITGTVTVVSGDKLYVTAADGSVYTVTTTGSTVVNVTQSGTVSQIKPGQTVVIAGSNDNSGDVTATSITAGSGTTSTSGSKNTGGQ